MRKFSLKCFLYVSQSWHMHTSIRGKQCHLILEDQGYSFVAGSIFTVRQYNLL